MFIKRPINIFRIIAFIIIALVSCSEKRQDTFTKFFKIQRTPDVKNLQFYADEMGIDASYWFSFSCHDSTVKKIIAVLHLKPDKQYIIVEHANGTVDSIPDNNGIRLYGGLNSHPTAWWDTAFIRKTTPYSRTEEILRWHLWYDSATHKVYFLHYDR